MYAVQNDIELKFNSVIGSV